MLFRLKKIILLLVAMLTVSPLMAIDLKRVNVIYDFFADEEGAEKVYFTVYIPPQDKDGNPVVQGDIAKLDVYRKYQNFAFTIENPVVDERIGVIDEEVEQGVTYTYDIIATDKDGNTYKYQNLMSAYVGFDVPAQIYQVSAVSDGEKVTLEWDAPTYGEHYGSKFNADELRYDIYRVESGNETLIAENVTATNYVDTPNPEEITGYKYSVIAKTNAGPSKAQTSKRVIVGKSHKTPFFESFANGYPQHDTWTVPASDFWEYSDKYCKIKSLDGDGGLLNTNLSQYNPSYSISSSPISLAGLKHPMLEFWYYAQPNLPDCKIEVEASDGTLTKPIGAVNYGGNESGWKVAHFPFGKFSDDQPVTLKFIATSKASVIIAIDKIAVNDFYDNDLAVARVQYPSKVNPGEDVEMRVTVRNDGLKAAQAYTLTVLREGNSIETFDADGLAVGESAVFSLKDHVAGKDVKWVKYDVCVAYGSDENSANDKKTVTVEIIPGVLPAVDVCKGATDATGAKLTLTWDAPLLSADGDNEITESFEDADNFSIEAPGEWSYFDGDGQKCYPLNDLEVKSDYKIYPDMYSPKAFQTIDTEETNNPNAAHPWKAHSGDKVLAAFSPYYGEQNDWLISPMLSGEEQTISFYALAHNSSWGKEQIFVYVSKFNADVDDFDVDAPVLSGKDAETGYEIVNTIMENKSYEKIEVDLPKGSRHFAIRVATPANDGFLVIDDVTYRKAVNEVEGHLVGYNVYCDDVKLNSTPLVDCSYELDNDGNPHSYVVKAVYEEGEAAASAPYRSGMTSIEEILANAEGSACTVYDLNGRLVKSVRNVSDLNALPAGVYLVNGRKVAHQQ